ncbi:hypothetical protein T08_6929 [Trichinella sp. T8]|nr:hypothetical protein T08_6929 [Trichinella sp. T8]
MNFYKSALSFQLDSSRQEARAELCDQAQAVGKKEGIRRRLATATAEATERSSPTASALLNQHHQLNGRQINFPIRENRPMEKQQSSPFEENRKRNCQSTVRYKTATAEQMEQEKSDLQLHFVKSSALELQNAELDAIASTNFSPARQLLRS